MATKMKPLSLSMLALMSEAIKRPVHQYGNTAQIKVLAKRGMMRQVRGEWVLTDAGIEELKADKNTVALNYASYFLRAGGFQIRHNIQRIDQSFNDGEYFMRHEWYQRSFLEEVNAVADFMERAIELTRAEIRAGVAS